LLSLTVTDFSSLGFMDAAELVDELRRLHRQGKDIGQHLYLRRYERSRKHSAAMMLAGMQGFRELFAGSNPAKKLLRDLGLKLADTLEKAYSAGITPEQSQTLVNQAALAEFMRGLGFVPMIATTALATGVYAVAGFTFVYAVGYLAPNPWIAAILGVLVISAEVLLLRSIGKWLGRYPSVRNASDNIRNAMNMLMEMALLIGSIFAAIKMAGYTGFSIAVAIYFLNESIGRPVQKMAAPVVAVMITGILLNILYWFGLFVPA
jgi:hypothetical protein